MKCAHNLIIFIDSSQRSVSNLKEFTLKNHNQAWEISEHCDRKNIADGRP